MRTSRNRITGRAAIAYAAGSAHRVRIIWGRLRDWELGRSPAAAAVLAEGDRSSRCARARAACWAPGTRRVGRWSGAGADPPHAEASGGRRVGGGAPAVAVRRSAVPLGARASRGVLGRIGSVRGARLGGGRGSGGTDQGSPGGVGDARAVRNKRPHLHMHARATHGAGTSVLGRLPEGGFAGSGR